MRRFRQAVLPVIVAMAVMLSMIASAGANTGGNLPGWGDNSGKDLKAGPLGVTGSAATGQVPIAMQIPDAGVDAEVEKNKIVDGQMLDPSGPWVVSWYQETAKAGDASSYKNMVVSGHVDYWDVGPAIFQNLASLAEGAQIMVTGENGDVFTYIVDTVELVDADPGQEKLQEIVGPSDIPTLTIITCGGQFDYDKGEYPHRTIVRAHLEGTDQGAGASGTAASTSENTGVGSLLSGDRAQAKDDNVNVRSDASTSADVVTTLNKDDEVTITGDSVEADDHVWFPIETADGETGWVVQDYLMPVGN